MVFEEYILTYFGIPISLMVILLVAAFYQFVYKYWTFFSDRDVCFNRGIPVLGSNYRMLMGKEALGPAFQRLYNEYPAERLIGMYDVGGYPQYILRDPQLIKQITIKDFEHFLNHRVDVGEQTDPLMAKSLFFIKNQEWKDMRSTLSPLFTGSKMRLMLSLMTKCCEGFVKYLNVNEAGGDPMRSKVYEMKDIFSRFANDTIATCAFGLEVNSMQNQQNDFYTTGRSMTENTTAVLLKFLGFSTCPRLMNLLKLRIISGTDENYFRDVVQKTIAYRNEHGVVRNDMINLLMQASHGTLSSNSDLKDDNLGYATAVESSFTGQKVRDLTENDIVSQCLIFFIAGFDTVSTTLCFMAHELAINPDVQQRLFDEISETQRQLCGTTITYETLQQMRYLDMVISETLRKWPPLGALDRISTKAMSLENRNGSQVPIQVGDGFWIPVYAIHRDSQYYSDPDRFDPERFSEQNVGNIANGTYMPFGIGPRICIGSRFALMECKAIFYHMLLQFRVEKCAQTQDPLRLGKGITAIAERGFWVQLTRR